MNLNESELQLVSRFVNGLRSEIRERKFFLGQSGLLMRLCLALTIETKMQRNNYYNELSKEWPNNDHIIDPSNLLGLF